MINDDENVALCALNKIFGYHPRLALSLMEAAGSAAAVFSGEKPCLPGYPELAAQLNASTLDWAAAEIKSVTEKGFRFLGLSDPEYPDALREIPDPPLGLYMNGSSSPAEIFQLHPLVGVVGTRDISPYGKDWCRKLVQGLADAPVKPCIVSGLALGADGIAHRTALECGLPTIGVMATGIDSVYPWQHEPLAMEMVRTPRCALVTDYPMGNAPLALNFIRRNRIIAALVRAVIVVESKTKGGSLMTAKYACGYDREVYALPGRADDIRSAGCNSLIRENMALIITTPEDLAARLGLGAPMRRAGASWVSGPEGFRSSLERRYPAVPEAVRLGMAVYRHRGITPEELASLLDLPYPRILELAGLLEADGFLTMDLLRRCSALERR